MSQSHCIWFSFLNRIISSNPFLFPAFGSSQWTVDHAQNMRSLVWNILCRQPHTNTQSHEYRETPYTHICYIHAHRLNNWLSAFSINPTYHSNVVFVATLSSRLLYFWFTLMTYCLSMFLLCFRLFCLSSYIPFSINLIASGKGSFSFYFVYLVYRLFIYTQLLFLCLYMSHGRRMLLLLLLLSSSSVFVHRLSLREIPMKSDGARWIRTFFYLWFVIEIV